MVEEEHYDRLKKYYATSQICYNFLLGGSAHHGFYPKGKRINEKTAQLIMNDLVAEKLNLTAKDRLLDAGCGEGFVSRHLAKKYGCTINGIDVVSFRIEKAKKLAQNMKALEKVNYSIMDYSETKFNDEIFDCVYTTETLSHSIEVRKTLKEFFRVLKKGGRIALFEYTITQDKDFSEYEMRMLDIVIRSSAMDGLKSFRHEKFKELLLDAGFKDIKAEEISENVMPTVKRLRRFMVVPYYLFVKPFGLQEKFPNLTAAVEYYNMAKKALIHYVVFTAKKP